MNHKEIRHAFIQIITLAENAKCKDLNHPRKEQQHGEEFLCPVEYELQKNANIVREFAKAHGVKI